MGSSALARRRVTPFQLVSLFIPKFVFSQIRRQLLAQPREGSALPGRFWDHRQPYGAGKGGDTERVPPPLHTPHPEPTVPCLPRRRVFTAKRPRAAGGNRGFLVGHSWIYRRFRAAPAVGHPKSVHHRPPPTPDSVPHLAGARAAVWGGRRGRSPHITTTTLSQTGRGKKYLVGNFPSVSLWLPVVRNESLIRRRNSLPWTLVGGQSRGNPPP